MSIGAIIGITGTGDDTGYGARQALEFSDATVGASGVVHM